MTEYLQRISHIRTYTMPNLPNFLVILLAESLVIPTLCGMPSSMNIRILTPTVYPPFSPRAFVYIAPAIDTALLDIESQYPFLNVTHQPVYSRTVSNCAEWERENDYHFASAYYRNGSRWTQETSDVTAVICAGCTEVYSLANFATNWNILLITR